MQPTIHPTAAMPLVAYGYARLSREEASANVSASIQNQCQYLRDYCASHNIILADIFTDDGYSGSNFDRPGFHSLLQALENNRADLVITKDLSRLGRDMRESSYYAEEYFPERGIVYLGLGDNFDSSGSNPFAPLQFAVNEVMLRQTSQKIKMVLNNKKANGQYCAAPPYGYKKDHAHGLLVPDELSAPVVRRIFQMAADGTSTRAICRALEQDGILPPLKFKALYRAAFSAKGMRRVSDAWQNTTVVRILRNEVYLGHTLLGKTVKPSLKSKKKLPQERSQWSVHYNTHEPLVSRQLFDRAQQNLGYQRKHLDDNPRVRRSIFSGLIRCADCGGAMCSCGTTYKGEREKYWYLSCGYSRSSRGCGRTRIRYRDLCELVRRDLDIMIRSSCVDFDTLLARLTQQAQGQDAAPARPDHAHDIRLREIDAAIRKLYTDNAGGRISDQTLSVLVPDLEQEARSLRALLAAARVEAEADLPQEARYRALFDAARRFRPGDPLTREAVVALIDRIEVHPRQGSGAQSRQKIVIHYKFIGSLEPLRQAAGL